MLQLFPLHIYISLIFKWLDTFGNQKVLDEISSVNSLYNMQFSVDVLVEMLQGWSQPQGEEQAVIDSNGQSVMLLPYPHGYAINGVPFKKIPDTFAEFISDAYRVKAKIYLNESLASRLSISHDILIETQKEPT